MKEKEYNLMQFINMKFEIKKNIKKNLEIILFKKKNNEIVDLPNLEQKQTKHGRDKEAEIINKNIYKK